MAKFEKKKEILKRTFTKKTWYDWCDWLINCIPEPILSVFLEPGIIVNQNSSKLCTEVETNQAH